MGKLINCSISLMTKLTVYSRRYLSAIMMCSRILSMEYSPISKCMGLLAVLTTSPDTWLNIIVGSGKYKIDNVN